MRPDIDRYRALAFEGGLYVVKADGSKVPIPPILEPTVADLEAPGAEAQALVALAARAAARQELRDLGSFVPMEERAILARREAEAAGMPLRLVTGRVDTMGAKILEVNVTIPAMQGYADIVAGAFLEACGRSDLNQENGSNRDDLLGALREIVPRLSQLAIVAREGDAQQGELESYVRHFKHRGVETRIVTPSEVRIAGPGRIEASGEPVDLVYRHIFSWRVEPDSDFGRILVAPNEFPLANPVVADIEAKACLGTLSSAAEEGAEWLTLEERSLVQRVVPWTRRLDAERAESAKSDEERQRLVLKRSWDYGGRSVHLGLDTPPDRWRQLLDEALAGRDIWVLQERVPVMPEPRTIAGGPAISGYVNLCAFANLGLATRPHGGASRVAPNRIVNILGGGGLAPVLRPEVAAALERIKT